MIAHPSSPAVLTAAFLAGAWLGEAGAEAQERRWPALFRESAEVVVANVEVFVSDRAGRPVDGLGKDDFELLVDGRPVEISNFYAVDGAGSARRDAATDAPAAEERSLRLVVFVDDENITAANRRKLFQRLRELVLGLRRSDLSMMLVAHEGSAASPLVVRRGFTSIPHEIFVALDELEHASTGSRGLERDRRRLLSAIQELAVDPGTDFSGAKADPVRLRADADAAARALLPEIEAYATEAQTQVRRTLASLGQVVDMLAPVPGEKALLFLSDGLPLKPGQALIESWSDRVELLRGMSGEVSPWSEAARFDVTPDFVELVARANAGRVTFYPLVGAAPAELRRGAAESQGTFGVRTLEPFAGAKYEDSLLLLADGTGGRAALSGSDLDAALDAVLADFDHRYSLGFLAGAEAGDERQHAVEVEVANREYRVRWRRSIRVSRPEELARQRVLAALVLGGEAEPDNPLGIAVGAPEIRPAEDGRFVVPLVVQVPLAKLVLVPQGSEHSARLSLYVAARDGAGRTSDVTRHLCPVRIPNSEVLLALGRTTACGVRLLMRGGEQQVAVAVRDEVADTVSVVRFALDVPGSADDRAEGPR